jgi:hypothetical protein
MGIATMGSTVLGSLRLMWVWRFFEFIGRPIEGPILETFGSGFSVPYHLWTSMAYAIPWLILDWRHRDGWFLHQVAELLCRFALLGRVVGYAWVKIPVTSWPAGLAIPSVAAQYTQFGDATGSMFFWWWIGVSRLYRAFVTWAEIGSALLLISRRTAPLGALLCAHLMFSIGVMMATFSHRNVITTVPMTACAVSLLLVWQYRQRYVDFFLHDRAVVQPPRRFLWPKQWIRPLMAVLAIAFIARELYMLDFATASYDETKQRRPEFTFYRTPFDGFYRVTHFERSGATPPAEHWRHVTISRCGVIARTIEDRTSYVALKRDSTARNIVDCDFLGDRHPGHSLVLYGYNRATYTRLDVDTLRYSQTVDGEILLTGLLAKDNVSIRLSRIPDPNFPFYNPRWAKVKRDTSSGS